MDDAPLDEWQVTREIENQMAKDLGADSLRYLPVESVSRAIGLPPERLCQACINGHYPTPWGEKLAKEAFDEYQADFTLTGSQKFNCNRSRILGGH
jgi:glutamine phosphoribosylpyrophosphate amidotransferase